MLQHFELLDERIREAQGGSADALGELFEGCRQYLLLVANQELRRDLQAKVGASDLVQQTFLEAQSGFDKFEGRSQGDLLVWLRQILKNNLRDATRSYRGASKRQVQREIAIAADEDSAAISTTLLVDRNESPSWPARQCEQNAALHQALARLSACQRQVIVMRNLELKSFVEIAECMARSPDAVRKLWGRAVQALAALLGDSDVLS
jgi:RNA polymerase sigma-70 factor (ECF subfamily)